MVKVPTKLSIIRKALENNSVMKVVNVHREYHLPHIRPGKEVHPVDIYEFKVAPEMPVYDVDALQQLMLCLVPPSLEPTSINDFFPYADGSGMDFGSLVFDEDIGLKKGKEEVIITAQDLLKDKSLKEKGFTDGKRTLTYTNPLRRRIEVRLYPNEEIAKNEHYKCYIDGKALEKYRKESKKD